MAALISMILLHHRRDARPASRPSEPVSARIGDALDIHASDASRWLSAFIGRSSLSQQPDAPLRLELPAVAPEQDVSGVPMCREQQKRASRPHFTDQEALQFHSQGRPGKLEIIATKPMATQRDLSLAYSPGVAVPVLAIAEDPEPGLRLHGQGQSRRRHHQRHRDPRPRQSRRAGLQAGDGRQGRAVQALRRRRCRSTSRSIPRTRTNSSIACAISAPPSAASIWKTSRRRSVSSSSSGCAS